MQSVYRFRQAEVGLFLRTRDHGLNSIRPGVLQLTRNFRSHRNLVAWFNAVFAQVLPDADDLTRGAVRHVASAAGRDAPGAATVQVHCAFTSNWREEAQQVADLVASRYVTGMQRTIGILVRYRRQAIEIAAALRERKLPFQAIELETLESQPVVRDLTALARALLHLGDRAAWLAVLRSPFCGLTLADLSALTRDDEQSICWELLNQHARLESLSTDGMRRARALIAVMGWALDRVRREPLRAGVERTWLSLGGPATLREPRALEDAHAFLKRLEELSVRNALESGPAFEVGFADLYARPDPTAGPQIQVMTIHQAKGLQFDIVVIPRLGDGKSAPDEPLLRWLEIPRATGEPGLLLAPIGEKGAEEDPLFEYLKRRERERESFERARLLYVAVTRAAEELHLFGHVRLRKDRDDEPGDPEANSFLALLWPVLSDHFARAFEESAITRTGYVEDDRRAPAMIRRLTADWCLPPPPQGIVAPSTAPVEAAIPSRPEFDWASETSRRVGTLVHQELESWSRLSTLPEPEAIRARKVNFRRRLKASGVPEERLEAAADRVIEALIHTRTDARGSWIFAPTHREAHNELALTGAIDGELVRIVIDRTFLEQSGARWIVDFKTGSHEGADREAFLDREVERYRPQLARYVQLLQPDGGGEIRVGLYFPLMGGWREWSAR
jgi:ATP-dependent exoDNAse (exonuclease V) beta subunit